MAIDYRIMIIDVFHIHIWRKLENTVNIWLNSIFDDMAMNIDAKVDPKNLLTNCGQVSGWCEVLSLETP